MNHSQTFRDSRLFLERSLLLLELLLVATAACGDSSQPPPEPAKPVFEAHRNLDYRPEETYAEGKDLLDVFSPPEADDAPVLIFLHGGGLVGGDKGFSNYATPDRPLVPDFVPTRFVPEGIVLVTANYRLSPTVMHPEHARDAAFIVRWVHDNVERYGGDPAKIFLAGHSAGAYLAALIGTDERYLEAVGLKTSDLAGVIPVSAFVHVPEVAPDRSKAIWGESEEVWQDASVATHVGPGRPPFLLLFADGDDAWRRDQNRRFQTQMLEAGNRVVELREIADRNHISIWTRIVEPGDEASQAMVDFIRRFD